MSDKKPRKLVVKRTFRDKKLNGTGVHRIATITYEYNRPNKKLKYGASMFKYDKEDDKFNKRFHNHTAEKRLEKRPVVVDDFEDTDTLKTFHEKIRNLLYSYGVKGERV